MRTNGRGVLSDLAKGAVAGAVATWVMNTVTTQVYDLEPEPVRERESAARGGESAYARAAEKIAGSAGLQLGERTKSRAATSIHWMTGIGGGAAYAVLRRRWSLVARGLGLGYGTGFFVLVDEVMSPMLGLTPGPRAFPWETHARGLAGHLTFGAVTESRLRVLDRVTRRQKLLILVGLWERGTGTLGYLSL